MKRIVLLILLLSVAILATTAADNKYLLFSGAVGDVTSPPKIEYYIDFSSLESTSFGFSSRFVNDGVPPDPRTSLALEAKANANDGKDPSEWTLIGQGTCYVYWDVVTTKSFTVSISLDGAMKATAKDGSTIATLDWSCEIFEDATATGNPKVFGAPDYKQIDLFSSSAQGKQSLETIGSRRLEFTTTENAIGKPAEEFVGTVILSVTIES